MKEGQGVQFILWPLSLVVSFGLLGCTPFTPQPPATQNSVLGSVPEGGWLLADEQGMTTYDRQGKQAARQAYLVGQVVQGVLLRPATREPIVIVKDGETWIIWLLKQGEWTAVYSSKVAFSSCDLAPNGHALLCVQAGDLNLIRFSDQHIQRLDSGVLDAVWSSTNTDVLVSYADHADLVALDLDDQVATRTVLATQTVSGQQFVDSGQVVWWTGDGIQGERQLQLYLLRSGETKTLWTGVADPEVWVEAQGNRVAVSDNRTCDPSCTTTVMSLPVGTSLQTAEGVIPAGWSGKDLITAVPETPIDQAHSQTYHFSTLGADQSTSDLGNGIFLASDHLLHLSFTQ